MTIENYDKIEAQEDATTKNMGAQNLAAECVNEIGQLSSSTCGRVGLRYLRYNLKSLQTESQACEFEYLCLHTNRNSGSKYVRMHESDCAIL